MTPIAIRRIAHNTIAQIIGKVFAMLITLYSLRVLIGYVNEEVYATYATAQAFLTFASVLADMGLYMVFMQEIAKPGSYEEKKGVLGNIMAVRLCSAIVFFALAPLTAYVFFRNYSQETHLLILMGTLAFLPLAINQLLVALFQKELKTYATIASELAGRAVFLIAIMITGALGGTIRHIVIGLIVGNVVQFGITWAFSRTIVRIPLCWNGAVWKRILERAWPLAAAIVLNLVYFKIDALMLSKMEGEASVAIYSVAYKVLEVSTIVPGLLLGLMLPYLAKQAKTHMKEFSETFEKALFAIISLAIPTTIGGILLAKPIVLLISDGKFPESAFILELLMVASGIIFFGNLFNHGVIALEKQKTITWVYAVGAMLSIVTNLIAIPRYSIVGAAVTTILVEFTVMLLVGIALRKHRPWRWPVGQIAKVTLASAAMAGVLVLTRDLSFFITLLAGGATYGVVLILVRGIPKTLLTSFLPKHTH